MRQDPTAGAALLVGAAALMLWACEKPPRTGEPLRGLSAQERHRFDEGRKLFANEFTSETGLGPLFNEVSCGECHEEPDLGGHGDEVEVHATRLLSDGFCDPLAELGGPVFQQQVTPALHEALGIDLEPIPEEATARGMRSSPDLFGFGLLDAVPDSELLAMSDSEDHNHDGISGRPNRFVDGRIGRFGRKAFVPTLSEFNEGAFPNEQGVTTPGFPEEGTVGGRPIPPGVDPLPEPEIDSRNLDLVIDFVRFLAPPPPGKLTRPVRLGRGLFQRIGCTGCHVPELRTGYSPVRALAHMRVRAYTDLLLHDMGPDLADICLGLATPSEFRTEPLMGLGLSTRFLHDGRAASLDEAVREHGGEAQSSRDRYLALTPSERAALLEFLRSL